MNQNSTQKNTHQLPIIIFTSFFFSACVTLPGEIGENEYDDAVGSITISTPTFTPITTSAQGNKALHFGTLRNEQTLAAAIDVPSVGITQLSYEALKAGLKAKFAGDQLSDSLTKKSDLSKTIEAAEDSEGTKSSTSEKRESDEYNRERRRTFTSPDTPTDFQTSDYIETPETVQKQMWEILKRAEQENKFSPAIKASLIAAYKLQMINMEEYYNLEGASFGGASASDYLPYKMHFTVTAEPGWYTRYYPYDAVIDFKLQTKGDAKNDFKVLAVMPAETAQTLDQLNSSLRKIQTALGLEGTFKSVAARLQLQSVKEAVERLQGLRAQKRIIVGFPSENHIRIRFRPVTVPTKETVDFQPTARVFTALVLIKNTIKRDKENFKRVLSVVGLDPETIYDDGELKTRWGKLETALKNVDKQEIEIRSVFDKLRVEYTSFIDNLKPKLKAKEAECESKKSDYKSIQKSKKEDLRDLESTLSGYEKRILDITNAEGKEGELRKLQKQKAIQTSKIYATKKDISLVASKIIEFEGDRRAIFLGLKQLQINFEEFSMVKFNRKILSPELLRDRGKGQLIGGLKEDLSKIRIQHSRISSFREHFLTLTGSSEYSLPPQVKELTPTALYTAEITKILKRARELIVQLDQLNDKYSIAINESRNYYREVKPDRNRHCKYTATSYFAPALRDIAGDWSPPKQWGLLGGRIPSYPIKRLAVNTESTDNDETKSDNVAIIPIWPGPAATPFRISNAFGYYWGIYHLVAEKTTALAELKKSVSEAKKKSESADGDFKAKNETLQKLKSKVVDAKKIVEQLEKSQSDPKKLAEAREKLINAEREEKEANSNQKNSRKSKDKANETYNNLLKLSKNAAAELEVLKVKAAREGRAYVGYRIESAPRWLTSAEDSRPTKIWIRIVSAEEAMSGKSMVSNSGYNPRQFRFAGTGGVGGTIAIPYLDLSLSQPITDPAKYGTGSWNTIRVFLEAILVDKLSEEVVISDNGKIVVFDSQGDQLVDAVFKREVIEVVLEPRSKVPGNAPIYKASNSTDK